jgi:Fungalysin/Thermolysin Propeptide Motif
MRKYRVLAPLIAVGLLVAAGTPAHAAPSGVPAGLRQVQVRHSLLGTHTRYQQTYRGIPVVGGFYARTPTRPER